MISWDKETNERLLAASGYCFEDARREIKAGRILALVQNPSVANQKTFVIRLAGYVCNVPYTADPEGNIFLTGIY